MSGLLCMGHKSREATSPYRRTSKKPKEKEKEKKDHFSLSFRSRKKKNKSFDNGSSTSSLSERVGNSDGMSSETSSVQSASSDITVAELRVKLAEVESECAILRKENEELESYRLQLEQFYKSIEDTELEIERLRKDNIIAIADVNIKTQEIADLATLLRQKETENENLEKELATRNEIVFCSQGTQTEIENTLQKELDKTKESLYEVATALRQLKIINDHLENENSSLENASKHAQEEVKSLVRENVSLELEKRKLVEKLTNYEAMLQKHIPCSPNWKDFSKKINGRLSDAERNQNELSQLIDDISDSVKTLEIKQTRMEKPEHRGNRNS